MIVNISQWMPFVKSHYQACSIKWVNNIIESTNQGDIDNDDEIEKMYAIPLGTVVEDGTYLTEGDTYLMDLNEVSASYASYLESL